MTIDLDGEVVRIQKVLAAQRARRDRLSITTCDVRIDGTFVGRFDTPLVDCRFRVSEAANLIEVFGHDAEGEILVATHVILRDESGELAPGGSKVNVGAASTITFAIDSSRGLGVAVCTVAVGTPVSVGVERRPAAAPPITRRAALAIAATLAIVSGGLAWQNYRLRQEATLLQAGLTEVRPAVAQPQPRLVIVEGSTAGPTTALPSSVLGRVTLQPGVTRGKRNLSTSASPNRVTLQPGVRIVAIKLAVADNAPSGEYRATIERGGREALPPVSGLTIETSNAGERTVAFTAPADVLRAGGYLIRLAHITDDDRVEDLSIYRLRVVRSAPTVVTTGTLAVDNRTGAPLAVTTSSQSAVAPQGAFTMDLAPGTVSISIVSQCGASERTVTIRQGKQTPLAATCESR